MRFFNAIPKVASRGKNQLAAILPVWYLVLTLHPLWKPRQSDIVMRSRGQKVVHFEMPATRLLSQAEWRKRVRPRGVPMCCCKESRGETPDVSQLKLYTVSDDSPPRRQLPLLSTQKHVCLWRCVLSFQTRWATDHRGASVQWYVGLGSGEKGEKKTSTALPEWKLIPL